MEGGAKQRPGHQQDSTGVKLAACQVLPLCCWLHKGSGGTGPVVIGKPASSPVEKRFLHAIFQGRKKQHKHKLFGPDFPRTFLTLTPGRPWVKKFLPITGAAEKPHFLVRTSTIFGADVHDPKGSRKTLYKKRLRWFFAPKSFRARELITVVLAVTPQLNYWRWNFFSNHYSFGGRQEWLW